MLPVISVIITSYNYARFVDEAIQSVLDQTYQDFEVIVVDDGSTDDTRSVLDRFGDRITCIYQANQGKSIALNRGIAVSRGRYLAFLDSDDCWLPHSLQARLAAFEDDPELGVVYGRTLVIDETGRVLPRLRCWQK
jgi:glycosyltransferase involved in cell wall biosynthesis